MKTVKISVTKNDIKRGWSGGSDKCPIKLAVSRKLKTGRVYVSPWQQWDKIEINGKTYRMPDIAGNFSELQTDFSMDNAGPSKKLRPFTFTINMVAEK